jgi:carbohydrate-selective porin OprB
VKRLLRLVVALVPLVVPATAPGEEEISVVVPPDQLERRRPTLPTVEPSTRLVTINGILRGGLQWIATGEQARHVVFGSGSLDLNVVVRPTDYARVFLDVEALGGRNPDQALGSLSRLNHDVDQLEGSERKLIVRELWLRLALLDGQVRFSVGKLDPAHYFDRNFFAEDDATQFLDSALLNNPMLKPPPNGPGAALRVSVGDWRYAFGVHAPDDVDGDLSGLPYLIGELGRRNIFPLRGHYRLWARLGSLPENRDRLTWGSGLSIDQLVTRQIGVFLRAGLSRNQDEDFTSHAWSGGLQVAPTWLDRPKDKFGAGYSFQREVSGREELVEVYYTLGVADWLSLTANVQWLLSGPNQVRGGTNHNVVIPGIRVLLLF